MSILTIDIRQGITDALNIASDDGLTLASIANAMKLGPSGIRPILNELVVRNIVRSTKGPRNVRFWIPSLATLEAEARNRDSVKVFKPLTMDRAKLERYAELDAARNSIKSIG